MSSSHSFDLSPQKQKLLTRLLRERGLEHTRRSAGILSRPDGVPPPLSFAQERLWYIEKLKPGSAAYNIPVAIRLQGSLDVTALHRSLNQVIQRYEILRTTIVLEAAQPEQRILADLEIALPLQELPAGEPDILQERLQQALDAEAREPFDLENGPLLRASLLRLAPNEHIFLFTIHHIIADGWSLAIFFRDVSACYTALVAGRTLELPPLLIQYADFAYWQRDRLSGDLSAAQLEYWQEQLSGKLPEMALPLDRSRPVTQTFPGRWLSQTLPTTLVDGLKSLARAEETTLFVVLLAALNTVLQRYSGQDDLLVGSPVTNRIHRELEDQVGHFINTLVLRSDLSGPLTFRDLIHREKDVVLDAYTHQDIPFEYLLDALQPARDLRKNPLFQIAFIMQDTPARGNWRTALELPGVKASQLFTHSQTAKLDLTLEAEEQAGELILSFEYNTDIFVADTIERLAGHFQRLLAGLVRNPDRQLSTYQLLTSREAQQLSEWNETRTDYPSQQCVHALFEAFAADTPEATALVQGGRRLSYDELNRRANQLAHRLRQLGVGPDIPVGICAQRSLAFVTGVLAILKAGGAYVPMDANYPQERLSYMLANAKAPVLLLQSDLSARLTHDTGITILLDTLGSPVGSDIATEPFNNPRSGVDPQNLACIIYTSGSTGQPKGVAIPHYAINRLVRSTNYMSFDPDDVIVHMSNVAFDAATYEIWGALLNGLALAIAPYETVLSPDEFAAFLEAHHVSVIMIITALFNQMAYSRPDIYARLRVVMFGGEACDPQAVRLVSDRFPPQSLLHVYGPAESTTYASWYPVQDVPPGASTVPIGYPLANTTLYVLDRHLNPVPPGTAGELFIGGDGLARGYYSQPALTAAAFIANPFGEKPGARLYRTGDLVRLQLDPDGEKHLVVEFVGRVDNQVKMSGFRIELGEIEAVISQHPAVRESVVLSREDVPGSQRLVAYLVKEAGQEVSRLELRHFLQARLPDYMLPAAYVMLETFPLTENGKVNRPALPAPSLERPLLETHFAAPLTETEHTIAAIWQQALRVQQVGRHDNFFDLGGNSLLLVKVHHDLQATIGRKVPIVQLFAYPTVRELAQNLDQLRGGKASMTASAVSAGLERGRRRRARTSRRSDGTE